jgi:hypothetical protein
MTSYPTDFYESLSPKIRKLVRQLHEWGYYTTDSGDGTNYAEGMDCAVPFPMVAIRLDEGTGPIDNEANHLHQRLEAAGVPMGTHSKTGERKVHASEAPGEPSFLVLLNITDDDLG